MVRQLGQRFCLRYSDPHGQVCTLQYSRADLFAKLRQITTVTHAGNITECLIDTVNFDTRTHLLMRRHHPVRHISIALIVIPEADHASAPEQVPLFEVRLPHRYTDVLCLCGPSNNTAIVI